MISIDETIVRVDGVRVPYFCTDNDFFKRMKESMQDENIYDTSEASVPFTNKIVTFVGSGATSGVDYQAWNEQQGFLRKIGPISTNATGGFEFSTILRNGKNRISVRSLDGTEVSNFVYLNAYRLGTWLCSYAEELERIRNTTAQTRQDSKLRDANDFDGDPIDNTGRGLTQSFGQFIEPLTRISTFTTEEWRQAIRDVLEAFNVAPSARAMRLATQFFTAQPPEFSFYMMENRLRRPRFTDENAFLVSAANPGVDTTPTWKERRFYLYNRWFNGLVSSPPLAGLDRSYIYYDGTTEATGLGSPNIVNFLAKPIISTLPPVATGTRMIEEIIVSGDILVDEDGSHTGLSGELHVRTSYPLAALNGVSGSTVQFLAGISTASVVSGTAFIDLGHAQVGQEKRSLIGDVTVSYETPREVYEVARIDCSSTTITGIITGERLDEVSGVIRETQVAEHAGELLVHGSQTLVSGSRNILTGVLESVKPAQTFWHVFMNDPTTGELVFYAKV